MDREYQQKFAKCPKVEALEHQGEFQLCFFCEDREARTAFIDSVKERLVEQEKVPNAPSKVLSSSSNNAGISSSSSTAAYESIEELFPSSSASCDSISSVTTGEASWSGGTEIRGDSFSAVNGVGDNLQEDSMDDDDGRKEASIRAAFKDGMDPTDIIFPG